MQANEKLSSFQLPTLSCNTTHTTLTTKTGGGHGNSKMFSPRRPWLAADLQPREVIVSQRIEADTFA